MQLAASLNGGAKIHPQAIRLDDPDIDRLGCIGDRPGRVVKQPFGCCRSNVNPNIGVKLTQRANHLVGPDCVAVTVTGNIVKNCSQSGFNCMKIETTR